MGYVPPPAPDLTRLAMIYDVGLQLLRSQPPTDGPVRLNLDRHGLPRDFATYEWLLYGKVVDDQSPQRLAFLHGGFGVPHFGQQWVTR